jgi:TrmH family RNA methyltransferase
MLSKQNIKYIQSLQYKKFRDEFGVFVAEGPKVILELLQDGGFRCSALYALADWIEKLDIELIKSLYNRLHVIQPFELEKIAHYTTPNAAVAVFEKRKQKTDTDLENQITIILDDIQDPGNLGTIIRTADWFGVKQLVCSEKTVDMYNSKVVQSTMASLGRVNVLYTDLFEWLKQKPTIKKYAAVVDKGKSLHSVEQTSGCMLMIGNESNGLSAEIMAFADELVTIPKSGKAESLNAAIATAIMLYELKR